MRAFLLMRFVRGEKCCISVFCVASRVPQHHPVVGKILSEASVPCCSQLLPSVIAPRRLSFSSSRPEKNLSIAAVDVGADSGSQQQQQQQPAHAAKDGLTSPLCDPPPPPVASLQRFEENSRGVQKRPAAVCQTGQPARCKPATWANAEVSAGKHPPNPQTASKTFIIQMITAPCRNVNHLYFIS